MNKKIALIISFVLMVLSALPAYAYVPEEQSQYAYTIASKRKEEIIEDIINSGNDKAVQKIDKKVMYLTKDTYVYDEDGSRIRKLKKDKRVKIIEKRDEQCKVIYGKGKEGYISKKVLTVDVPEKTTSEEEGADYEDNDKTFVTSRDMNIRSGPGKEYDIITIVKKGTEITPEKRHIETGWYMIEDGKYISYKYLAFIGRSEMESEAFSGRSEMESEAFSEMEPEDEVIEDKGKDEEIQASDLGKLKQSGSKPWQKCIEKVAPAVIEACEEVHLLPSVCIAQMIKESGLGTSKLAKESNNMGGIKQGKGKTFSESTWSGDTYTYVNSSTGKKTVYKKFSSVNEYITYRNAMLAHSSYYKGIEGETDPKKSMEILRKGGYWGDKNTGYVDDVMKIINKYDLTKYDKQLSWVE